MASRECFFYQIRATPDDADVVRQWMDARAAACAIRDAYERESEAKWVDACRRRARKRSAQHMATAHDSTADSRITRR